MKYDGEWIATGVSLRKFIWFQFGAATLLIILGIWHYLLREFGTASLWNHVSKYFDVGQEQTITTAFATLNLFVSSILLYACYSLNKFRCAPSTHYWLLLSAIFLLLSVDETASIHERSDGLIRLVGLEISELSHNRWVVVGAAFVVVVFLYFLPFLRSLPRKTALLFMLSGGIFVGGALGMEFVGAMMLEHGVVASRTEFIYALRRIVEEGMELYGIALFNCVLFSYLVPSTIGLEFTRNGA